MTKLHLPRRAILAAAPALLAAPAIVRAQGSKPEKSQIALPWAARAPSITCR